MTKGAGITSPFTLINGPAQTTSDMLIILFPHFLLPSCAFKSFNSATILHHGLFFPLTQGRSLH